MATVSELLRQYGLSPKKSWGQCFLHDRSVIERIADAAQIQPAETVVEIGAGLGVLTLQLAQRATRTIAIERDRELAEVLRREVGDRSEVQIHEANALTYDFAQLAPPLNVVGNLPYNIASPLLFRLLQYRDRIGSATLMLQREMAERIVAPPGSRTYGIPSVLCQRVAEVRICFHVGRGAFIPPPRVDSSVIHLQMRHGMRTEEDLFFASVVKAAFGSRRKTLLRALAAKFPEAKVREALAASAIDPQKRAETLAVSDFEQLSCALDRQLRSIP